MSKYRNKNGQFKSIDHNDIIRKRFGKLIVLSIDHVKGKHYYYKCKCDCNRDEYIIKERSALINNINNQCTRCYKEQKIQETINSIIGKQFGNLTVESFDHIEKTSNNQNKYIYKCKCEHDKYMYIDKFSLTNGLISSCKCGTLNTL